MPDVLRARGYTVRNTSVVDRKRGTVTNVEKLLADLKIEARDQPGNIGRAFLAAAEELERALEADRREGLEGYEEVEAVHWGGGITYSPEDDPHEIAAAHDHCRVVKILVPASPEPDKEKPPTLCANCGVASHGKIFCLSCDPHHMEGDRGDAVRGRYEAGQRDALEGGIEVEVEHHAPKAWYQGEQETNMLKEHAVFVDPISVARRLSPGRYVMFKREGG